MHEFSSRLMTILDIKVSIQLDEPLLIISGGQLLITTSRGTLKHAISVSFDPLRKSFSHQQLPFLHPYFAKPTLIQCTCQHLMGIHTLFKLIVHSQHGLNGTCYEEKLVAHLDFSFLKTCCAVGEDSRRSSLTMEPRLWLRSTGLHQNIISTTSIFQPTIQRPMELSNVHIERFVTHLSKPVKVTSLNGQCLRHISFGQTMSPLENPQDTRRFIWHMASNHCCPLTSQRPPFSCPIFLKTSQLMSSLQSAHNSSPNKTKTLHAFTNASLRVVMPR